MKIINNEKGFIVSVTAIIIAVILGLLVLYFSNSISLNITSSADNYSSSQANWAAVSGVEYTIMQLVDGIDGIVGTYPFFNSNIVIDTVTIDPVEHSMLITSTGTHSNSNVILSLTVKPTPADTLLDEGFEDDDGFTYYSKGKAGKKRYWGLSCVGELPNGTLPKYVLTGADSCFFFGMKVQNHSNLIFHPLVSNPDQDYILTLSLAAGIDKNKVQDQSKFQHGDYLEFRINGSLLERWEGPDGHGPLAPSVGNSAQNLTPNFEDYVFNLTNIFGAQDTFRLAIEGKTNKSNKYLGIEEISLTGLGGYSILAGGLTEI